MEMSRLTRDGTAKSVSRDQILRRERGRGSNHFPCSANHVQDWQPYPVDPYSCYMRDHTYMHTNIHTQIHTYIRRYIVCLVGEKPDKELPGIVGARGDTV